MKTQNKTGFTIDDKPDIMLDPLDFNDSFVSVPFIRVKVEERNQIKTQVLKKWSKLLAPISDSSMRHFDIVGNAKYQRDITKRIFSNVKHGKRRKNNVEQENAFSEVQFSL